MLSDKENTFFSLSLNHTHTHTHTGTFFPQLRSESEALEPGAGGTGALKVEGLLSRDGGTWWGMFCLVG